MPRFELDTGFPASNPRHRFTLTRLPVPSVLAPIGTDLAESSWGGPSSFGSSTTIPLPAPHPLVHRSAPASGVPPAARRRQITRRPKAPSVPGRLAEPFAGHGLPRALRTLQQVSVSHVTRGWPSARSDPTPAPVSRGVRRLVVAPSFPKESGSSVRCGREHCPCSDSAFAS
jgi:hypothetical protein